jgi:rhodanese-related sulfurtransferase
MSMNPVNPPEIDASALAKRLEQGGVALVDVREAEEHEDERIAGSVLAPMSAFDPAAIARAHEGRTIVLYCMSGTRSARAAALFAPAGLPTPITLREGIFGWKAAGLPTEGTDGKS